MTKKFVIYPLRNRNNHSILMQPTPTDTPLSFSSLSLAEPLLRAVKKLGFEQPTPVQQQAIPLALVHKDLLVSAETGSGKTAAFLLPTLHHLLTLSSGKPGTRALILAPTRELAQQIFKQCQQLIEFTDLTVGIITGGDDFRLQQNMLRRNTELVIATPGRVLELMEQEIPNFSNLEILILDEADRMLDMGFSEDVLTITKSCNTDRQTLLFSATLTHFGVIKMADKILKDHKVVALNTLHDGHRNIEQQIVVADDNDHKQKLLAWLLLNETYDKALVFTNSRIQADLLRGPLRGQKLRVGVLHGEMDQKDRNRMMQLFREGEVKEINFSAGIVKDEQEVVPCDQPNGTYVAFTPDVNVFKSYHYIDDYVVNMMKNYSFLNAGLILEFNGEKFQSKNGLRDLLEENMESESLYPVIHLKGTDIELAITHGNQYGEDYYSFVNGQHTTQGGTHLVVFREAIVKTIRDFYKKDFDPSDIRASIVAAISIKVEEPVFESQTKTKLGSKDIGPEGPKCPKFYLEFCSERTG